MDRPIQCDVCQATFTRPEHLTRHARSHTTEKPFQCPQCGKRFARLDVLHRHVQSHTQRTIYLRGGSTRACKECAISRVRCTRDNPCQRCQQRQLQCVYPVARKRKDRVLLEGQDSDPQLERNTNYDEENTLPLDHSSNVGEGFRLPAQHTSVPTHAEHHPDMVPGTDSSHLNLILEKDFTDEWVWSMPSANWLYPEYPDLSLPGSQFDDLPVHSVDAGVLQHGTNTPGVEMGMDRPGNIPIPDTAVSNPPDTDHPITQAADHFTSESVESTAVPLTSPSAEGSYYVDGIAGRAAFQGRLIRRHARMDSSTSTGEDTPFSGGGPSTTFISEEMYGGIPSRIQAECDSQGLALDMVTLPTRSEMQTLVQLYFDGFHTTYPFLRKDPSQFCSSESWLLLLAVAAVGSRDAYGARYERLGESLSYLVDQILRSRFSGYEPRENEQAWVPGANLQDSSGVDLVTVQAGVLNCLFLLHSGNRSSISRALVQRYSLIEASNRLGLLLALEPLVSGETDSRSSDGLVERWVRREARVRTGWMIWVLDSIVLYEFHSSPLLRIGEAKAPLPWREEIWHHPTVDMIKNERNWPVTLIDALEMLYLEKKLPPKLGGLSTNALIFAICRRTKEAVTQNQTELTYWSPKAKQQLRSRSQLPEESWPPTLPVLSKWRNSACDCLDILHWNANSAAAGAGGWEDPTIFHLHLARILLLVPIQHIQRLVGPQQPDQAAYKSSQNHVLRWAICDQYKARLGLIHAGAVFWYVRRYSSGGFLEPFGLYVSTLAVWAYSISVQLARRPGVPQRVPLDGDSQTPSHGSVPQHEVTQDPPHGDESESDIEPTVIQLDRPCDDEIVQMYVRLGPKMSARMSGVGGICEPSSPRRILKQGIQLLAGPEDRGLNLPVNTNGNPETPIPGWGIKHSFSESLRSLVATQATPEQEINRMDSRQR